MTSTMQIGIFNYKQQNLVNALLRFRIIKQIDDWYECTSPLTGNVICAYTKVRSWKLIICLLDKIMPKLMDEPSMAHLAEAQRSGFITEET